MLVMILRAVWLFFLAGLMLATTTYRRDDTFVNGSVYFVDADCYARMTRVEQVVQHPFHSIRSHDFENFPQGIQTHTTAPLDWLIALLAAVFVPFAAHALDMAGAWISPLLGLATLITLWVWSTRLRLPFRHAMLFLLAVSPILTQAFRLGRPDHQSLLLFLIAGGLAAEWTLWSRPGRLAAVAWGVSWGIALWTSLYEPLIIFILLLPLRIGFLRKAAFSRTWGLAWGVALGIFGLSIAFDGWRADMPSPEIREYFANWSRTIGELGHLPPLSPQFTGWLTWLAPALPFLLIWRYVQTRDSRILAILALLIATYALTCWQIRWGCYLALVTAMTLPFALPAIPSRIAASTLFVICLYPVAQQWDAMLHPDETAQAARADQTLDNIRLHDVARALISSDRTGILAPWWLSPAIAYWSGQPCVAGSSHESLPGIVDTARFYMSTDPDLARQILAARRVSYVIAYEPDRILQTSSALLGQPIPTRSMAETLYLAPQSAPPFLSLVYSNPYFRVYAVN